MRDKVHMGWLLGFVSVAIGVLFGQRKAEGSSVKKNINEKSPAITRWREVIEPLAIKYRIPIEFAMAYEAIESGGNIAAVGSKTATGPDGYPREIGLFQLYNPDDFKALGVTPASLCAYCVRPKPGPMLVKDDDGGYKDGTERNPQALSRAVTPQEMALHVDAGLRNIVRHMGRANETIATFGLSWRSNSPDYWALVKAFHGLPSRIPGWFAAVKARLGRAPISWREFRNTMTAIDPNVANPETLIGGAFDNAEWTGFHVQGPAVG